MKKLTLTLVLITIATTLMAQSTTDETDIVRTLQDFQSAIIENDSEKAAQFLLNEVQILESGNIETKEEYLSHHFHSDGRFLSAMDREIISQKVNTDGETAWVTTKSHLHGTYNERELSLNSLELAVLTKTGGNWKISALHWSSSDNS